MLFKSKIGIEFMPHLSLKYNHVSISSFIQLETKSKMSQWDLLGSLNFFLSIVHEYLFDKLALIVELF